MPKEGVLAALDSRESEGCNPSGSRGWGDAILHRRRRNPSLDCQPSHETLTIKKSIDFRIFFLFKLPSTVRA